MNEQIKTKLIVKPILLIVIALIAALFLINFLPYQLSKIPFLSNQGVSLPANVGYILIFAFTLGPILSLIKNLFLIRGMKNGDNPLCPDCSSPMKRKVAKKGKYSGQEFWGCLTFPKCSGKIHIG